MNFNVDDGKSMMSFASMLVSTNDAFIGSNAFDLSKSRTVYLNAYDSGTEANSEHCAYIPGPPVRQPWCTTQPRLKGSFTSTPAFTVARIPDWIPPNTIGTIPRPE